VYLGWYAGVRLGWGKWRLPEAVQVILIGVIMGWATVRILFLYEQEKCCMDYVLV
jgi:hypothetical protein